jgi:hypothetical protein
MDQNEFLRLLDQVADWKYKAFMSEGRGDEAKYIKINTIKDRACAYVPGEKNCDIQIKWISYKKFFLKTCRTCKHIIVNDQAYDAKGTTNVVNLCHNIINQQKKSIVKSE